MASKAAIYRTVVAMLRENGMTATDFVVEHIKVIEGKVKLLEIDLKSEKDRAFNKAGEDNDQ